MATHACVSYGQHNCLVLFVASEGIKRYETNSTKVSFN